MAAVTRELKIDYGGFAVGKDTDRVLTGKIELEESYETGVITFEFGIQKDTEAAFVSEVAAVEAAFSKPRERLVVTQGAATLKDFDPAKASGKNTGFNADPIITKRQDIGDTGRSRVYGVTITVDLPADLAAQLARRNSRILFTANASNWATLEITGAYTAQDDKDAKEQFDDNIDAYITVVINAHKDTGGGADRLFQVVEKITDTDETDKVLNFVVRLEEIRYPENQTASNEANFTQQSILVRRQRTRDGDAPGSVRIGKGSIIGRTGRDIALNVKRLVRIEVQYEVKLFTDHTTLVQTSQQIANEYNDFYLKISRPWIIESAKALGLNLVAVINEEPEPDPAAGILRAKIEMLATETTGTGDVILEFELREKIHEESGIALVPVWDGDRFSRHVFQGPGRRIRSRTERYRVLGIKSVTSAFGSFSLQPERGGWYPISQDTEASPLVLGSNDLNGVDGLIQVTDITNEKVWEFAKRKTGGNVRRRR